MRLLRRKDVSDKTGLQRSAIYDAMHRGTFPQCVKIRSKAVAWDEREIDEWIRAKLAARAAKAKAA
jgi:prophage regulatory protein